MLFFPVNPDTLSLFLPDVNTEHVPGFNQLKTKEIIKRTMKPKLPRSFFIMRSCSFAAFFARRQAC
ncbi:hypothetical protein BVY13_07035 [Bacillus amyloliquefaciens]|nr:hypothetical protein BVY13_07035 [Bacillus amyloliquefaciens]